MHKLISYTFYSEVFIYLIVMLVAYFSTYEKTNQIFLDRGDTNIFFIIGKFFYVICLVCNVGLYYYMIRPSLECVLKNNKEFTKLENTSISCVILLFLMFVSYLLNNISTIISLIGGTCQIYLMFIIPVLIYIKAFELSFAKKCIYLAFAGCLLLIGVSYLFLFLMNLFTDVLI